MERKPHIVEGRRLCDARLATVVRRLEDNCQELRSAYLEMDTKPTKSRKAD
jgi:hypothetical protein